MCRYSRAADWEYVTNCARQVPELPLIGNGDVFSWTDYQAHINADSPVATAMIARQVAKTEPQPTYTICMNVW